MVAYGGRYGHFIMSSYSGWEPGWPDHDLLTKRGGACRWFSGKMVWGSDALQSSQTQTWLNLIGW